jgi:hypothetical protein
MLTQTNRVPLAELEARAEWQILTSKQQAFLRAYIQSGVTTGTYDALGAVRFAYPTVDKNARIFSYEILANPKIDLLLGLHFGRTAQDRAKVRRQKSIKQLLREIRFHLKHAEPGSIAAQRLIAQHRATLLDLTPEEYVAADPEESPLVRVDVQPRSTIGSIVDREGKLFRVTAEDANFVPTAGDRVDKNGARIPEDSPLDFVAEITE